MKVLLLMAIGLALPLGGCSMVSKKSDDQSASVPVLAQIVTPHELIATDFVNVLSQLQAMPAASTTVDLQHSNQNEPFTLAFKAALQQAGYGIRWVVHNGSSTLFQYRRAVEAAAGSVQTNTYELAVGVVEMRRAYALDNNDRVRPVSPLYVRGVDASQLVLNDDIFDNNGQLPAAESPITSGSATAQGRNNASQLVDIQTVALKPPARKNRAASPAATSGQSTPALQVASDANPLDPRVAKAASSGPVSLPLIALPRAENVFELGGSNFRNLLSKHVIVKKQVLMFANDSMRLGGRNKLLVEQLVQHYNPQSDMFSVIGCSMGPTKVKGGNAALALARAGRVVEALRFAGVNDSRILDEGCWAGDGTIENLPRRGVVLTLNRRA